MKKDQFEKFDVNEVPLSGQNLVEASAGTGKTFSIALLTLRLILEKNIPIEKILLVTFTKNAVAELEERIRSFVRQAHDYAVYNKETPAHISTLVDRAANAKAEEVKTTLKDAVLFLDQLSVMTIHGFCQQSLSNQAFETGQMFGVEMKTSMDDIFDRYVNDFWRKHVNTLPMDLFRVLKERGFDRAQLKEVIKKHFAGKRFFEYDPAKKYQLVDDKFLKEYQRHLEACKVARQRFDDYVDENREMLRERMEGNAHARKKISDLDNKDALWKWLQEKKDKKYVTTLFGNNLLPLMQECEDADVIRGGHADELVNNIYCYAIQEIAHRVSAHMESAGMVSFDGLIKNLHTAITGSNQQAIVRELRSQFSAVFIDEFQDTDKLQYEIFKTAFSGDDTIVFYIGDPKQSIYAFRQADINTYFLASADVGNRYSMNTNFRSTKRMVDAMNRFFLPTKDFDTFYFGNSEDAIRYTPVDANPDAQGELYYDGQPAIAMPVEIHSKKAFVYAAATDTIFRLLTDPAFEIRNRKGSRRVKPSDIGVLVRSGPKGNDMKAELNRLNIPAVIFNDDKIMSSKEAAEVYLVLRAMHNPTSDNINAAVLNRFTGKSSEEVRHLKKDQLVELFRTYKTQWETRGINLALSSYVKDFGVTEYLVNPDTVNGLRMISNLNQIKELLTRVEYQQRLNQPELLDWIRRAKDLELLAEDEAVIRLENDADSVTISTIHKAKGLQYNIVIAPNLDLTTDPPRDAKFIELYQNGSYITIPISQPGEEQREFYRVQKEQENRRLMYVAITRAVYACFIYKNQYFAKTSSLSPFADLLSNSDTVSVQERSTEEMESVTLALKGKKYTPAKLLHPKPAFLKTDFLVREPNWQFMSYSSLALREDHVALPVENMDEQEGYDQFVFYQLRKGSITGTMLHEILENTDFQQPDQQPFVIPNAIRRYAISKQEQYNKWLPVMLNHVLNARIETSAGTFVLADVARKNCLHEMEFDFSVAGLDISALAGLCAKFGLDVRTIYRTGLQGIMNGFIDLFFEQDGKYYILDWKSNYLGATWDAYRLEALDAAMTDSNYHLQYLIYTVALVKYLRQRLPSFDYDKDFGGVIYCFLRGMRAGEPTGVFYRKPAKALIVRLEELFVRVVNLSKDDNS